jgi:hypothetical protein
MASFLQGSAVPAQTVATSGSSLSSLPDWYSNYAKDIIDQQAQTSMTPYATYTGPRVAGFTPSQQQGFDATTAAAQPGLYQPLLNAAQTATQNVATQGGGGLAAAQPYLDKSTQTAPSVVGDYMNPYTDSVVNRIAELGNRNLTENILPSIRDKFILGGSYGGTRNAELFGRGVREAQEGITAAQTGALQSGYNTSLGAAQTDLARQGTLGNIAGNLAGTDASTTLSAGSQLGELGALQQKLGLTGAGALTAMGTTQQAQDQANLDVGYQDFLKQQGYNQQQIDAMTGTLTKLGGALPKYSEESAIQPTGQQTTYSPSGLATGVGTAATLAGVLKSFGLV